MLISRLIVVTRGGLPFWSPFELLDYREGEGYFAYFELLLFLSLDEELLSPNHFLNIDKFL